MLTIFKGLLLREAKKTAATHCAANDLIVSEWNKSHAIDSRF